MKMMLVYLYQFAHNAFYFNFLPTLQPPPYVVHSPVTQNMPLHSKELCKKYGTCVWGWGGGISGKDPKLCMTGMFYSSYLNNL